MEKNLRFNSTLTEVKKINPLFSVGKARILYDGMNRNNSYLSRPSIDNAIPSIFNIPIVGEYIEETDNFGSHGGKLEITDTDVKFKVTTKPYGVIPESANIYWEDVTEKDGTVNSYLVADGIYLWTGRYEELNTLLEEEKYGQSMEIEVLNGGFAVVNGQETFKIDEFIFSALCILGIDKGDNPENHVEPAFESASISVYEFDKDSFKREFNQMLTELKFSLQKEGGNTVEEVKREFEETTVETPEQVEETVVEDVEVEEEIQSTETEETTQTETQSEEETAMEENEESTEFKNEETQEEKVEEEFQNVEDENSQNDNESQDEEVIEETFSKEFVEGLQSQIETLSSELEDLKSYKRQREEQDLASQFADKLSEDEMKQVFSTSKDLSLEEVETKLLALFGKKNFSIKQESKNENKIEIPVKDKAETINEPYNGLFSKYLSK